ncbi:hypothetical protein [Candidatus Sororendozoicomonas aggregata]|uniref:hypothetical protein n=1 Tax=Candidatus Sororendozoicomonas aggregata TaxID=3073239 RepID=UPI002ED2E0EC
MAPCKPIHLTFSMEADALHSKICQLIKKNRGEITGSKEEGTFIVPVPGFGKVAGRYALNHQAAILTITKHPLLLSCRMIESFFRKSLPKLEAEAV